MGLFSSDYKTHVATSVSRVVQDAFIPNAAKTGLIKAIFNNGDVVDHVLEEMVTGIGVRAERMFEYGGRGYEYGLPSGRVFVSDEANAEVGALLTTLEGAPVFVEYSQFGPPNYLHIGWVQLIAQYDYNPTTNILNGVVVPGGFPAYLHDIQTVLRSGNLASFDAGRLEQWGTTPRAGVTPLRPTASPVVGQLRGFGSIYEDPQATQDYLLVSYTHEVPEASWNTLNGTSRYVTSTLQIPLIPAYGLGTQDFFHVKYVVNGITKYWMYLQGAGTYPSLDTFFEDSPEVVGTYFPFGYFRFNGISGMADTTSPGYRSSKKLCGYLGLDYDHVVTGIAENPDIGNVTQAMFFMAVPANSTNQTELEYLYDYFNAQESIGGRVHPNQQQRKLTAATGELTRYSTVIKDSRFTMVLSDAGLYKSRKAGTIGEIGTFAGKQTTEAIPYDYLNNPGESTQTVTAYRNIISHHYQKQIGVGLYDEIVVVDLEMKYQVLTDYASTSDETGRILMIPLDHAITSRYKTHVRELLYARAMHIIFNSVQVVEVKWYQQSWFSNLLLIVAIVMTVLSLGTQGWSLSIAAALGATGYAAVAIAISLQLLVSYAFGQLLQLFVKAVGIEAAFVVAIFAALAGAYDVLTADSVVGAPWATELLQLANGLVSASSAVLSDLMGNLLGEYAVFDEHTKELQEGLNTANALLEQSHHMSPLVIFGESPNDFYNRTTHSGNIGVVGIRAISSYVENALKLPKLNATIGAASYE